MHLSTWGLRRPGVSVGLVIGGRHPANELVPYIAAQVIGGIAGAGILLTIASGTSGFDASAGFASNGYGALSPGGYNLTAVLVAEVVLTAMFLFIILGSTDGRAPAGFAPIPIGLGLTLIHLISIPVSNTSVNPAHSTAAAIFAGGDYLGQLWVFWLAPIIGGVIGALAYQLVAGGTEE